MTVPNFRRAGTGRARSFSKCRLALTFQGAMPNWPFRRTEFGRAVEPRTRTNQFSVK